MKISDTGFLAGFVLILLLMPAQAKAESFNEIALPSINNLTAGDQEIFDFKPIQAPLNKEEAEMLLSQLGISAKQKPRASKWDPFKAARALQISA